MRTLRTHRTARLVLPGVAVVATLLLLPCMARATQKFWIAGAGSGGWNVDGFWSPFGVPQDGDFVHLSPSDGFGRVAGFTGTGSLLMQYSSVDISPTGTGFMTVAQTGG